jgi:hypothetical protein
MVPICNDRESVLRVIDSFGDYQNPPAQLRLTRLHGRQQSDLSTLRASAQWMAAAELIAATSISPGLDLDA